MELSRLLSDSIRVLDVGAPDTQLAQTLADAGCRHYLALVPARFAVPITASPEFVNRFHPFVSPEQVFHCSTDLLILRASFARMAWGLRNLDQVRYLAVEVDSLTRGAEIWCAQFVARRSGRVVSRRRMTAAGLELEVFELPVEPSKRVRQYLSEVEGVEGLLRRLDGVDARYSVLRWFESLPALDPGEDLDILVGDDFLGTVKEILADEPGTIPVDLYSESGLPGSDYRGIAYYPPTIAKGILARAVRHASGALVPSPEDHFHSLAFHAIYHKGTSSGLPSTLVEPVSEPEHDYNAALRRLAASVGYGDPITMEHLDDLLAAQGWRPPADTLRRLADTNRWIELRFFANTSGTRELPELTAFFVRARTLSVLDKREILSELERLEFEILLARELDSDAEARAANLVRGGNWGRGPFPMSGGDPAMVILALHYGPRPVHPDDRRQYPRLTNSDVLLAKNTIRDRVRERAGVGHAFNPIHSSDDEFEAWEYVGVTLPDELEAFKARVEHRKNAYRTPSQIRDVLSLGRRAKVEVVHTVDGLAIRKTFGPHAMRYFAREVAAFDELGPLIKAIPPILDRGENWFTLPLYRDTLRTPDQPDGRLIPLPQVRQMVQVLREIHSLGADLIDAKPQNFLLDPHAGLVIVDLEFYHRYPTAARPLFEDNYSFVGVPPDFDGDRPFGVVNYDDRWRLFVGLSKASLLNDPHWLQRLKRGLYRAAAAAQIPVKLARSGARQARQLVTRLRSGLGDRYRAWARTLATTVDHERSREVEVTSDGRANFDRD